MLTPLTQGQTRNDSDEPPVFDPTKLNRSSFYGRKITLFSEKNGAFGLKGDLEDWIARTIYIFNQFVRCDCPASLTTPTEQDQPPRLPPSVEGYSSKFGYWSAQLRSPGCIPMRRL
jgi:hypothetical protein